MPFGRVPWRRRKSSHPDSFVVYPPVVGRGHCDRTVASEICANRFKDIGWKEVSNLFPVRSAYSDDDRIASVLADAAHTVTVIGHHSSFPSI